ncbi:MAG: polyprenyl synthetase family protein [Candidatus Avigastranaerophilus sp.]
MKIIENELNLLNKSLGNALNIVPEEISKDINNFVFSKSKRIRPALIFFVANAMNYKISNKILMLSAAVELIHNATLIHDDIIDNADIRRGNASLNITLGNNLSVLSGDILLSAAMQLLSKLGDMEIIELFSFTLQKMCEGEINQHFSLNKIPTIEEYLRKTQNKTAELFAAALESLCIIENSDYRNDIRNFAINFGIAFQIKDDLDNILNTDEGKPSLSDIHNGIYTLPVILLAENIKDITKMNNEEITAELRKNPAILNKTQETINEYINKAIASLGFMQDNQYKESIIKYSRKLNGAL